MSEAIIGMICLSVVACVYITNVYSTRRFELDIELAKARKAHADAEKELWKLKNKPASGKDGKHD